MAYQASVRGGVVRVSVEGDRFILGGQAVTVLRGELAAYSTLALQSNRLFPPAGCTSPKQSYPVLSDWRAKSRGPKWAKTGGQTYEELH
jgi:hypothetical protein